MLETVVLLQMFVEIMIHYYLKVWAFKKRLNYYYY